jgi:hypothetical protein
MAFSYSMIAIFFSMKFLLFSCYPNNSPKSLSLQNLPQKHGFIAHVYFQRAFTPMMRKCNAPISNENEYHSCLSEYKFPVLLSKGNIVSSNIYGINRIAMMSIFQLAAIYAQRANALEATKRELKSDEFEVMFSSDSIGLGLKEIEYKGSIRVIVQSIKDNTEAASISTLKPGLVLVAANGISLDGKMKLVDVGKIIKGLPKPFNVVFRDPSLFFLKLNSSNVLNDNNEILLKSPITTTVVPAFGGREEQVIQVERIQVSFCPL